MIAERRLIFRAADSRQRVIIYVAVGEPYDLEPDRKVGKDMVCACPVHIGVEDAGLTEVHGADKLQALGAAIHQVDLYLAGLVAAGELSWEDGRQYEPSYEAPFAPAMGEVIRRKLGRP
jgi:hypothetical protein